MECRRIMQKRVTDVRMRLKILIDVVGMVVGIVVDDIDRVEFSGILNLQGKCCPNFFVNKVMAWDWIRKCLWLMFGI